MEKKISLPVLAGLFFGTALVFFWIPGFPVGRVIAQASPLGGLFPWLVALLVALLSVAPAWMILQRLQPASTPSMRQLFSLEFLLLLSLHLLVLGAFFLRRGIVGAEWSYLALLPLYLMSLRSGIVGAFLALATLSILVGAGTHAGLGVYEQHRGLAQLYLLAASLLALAISTVREEQQSESRERTRHLDLYRAVFEASADALFVYDSSMQVTDVNATACALFESTREELLQTSPADLIADSSHEELARFLSLGRQGEPFFTEALFRRNASEFFIGSVRGLPFESQGESRYLCVLSDQSERREAAMLGRRMHGVFEAAPQFIGMAGPTGELLYLNPAGRALMGRGAKEAVTGLSIRTFHSQAEARRIFEVALPHAAEHGSWRGRVNFQHRDGEEIPTDQVVLAHRNETGQLEYWSTIALDLREMEKATRDLEENRAITRAALDGLGLAATVVDQEGNILHCSELWIDSVAQWNIPEYSTATPGGNWLGSLRRQKDGPASELCLLLDPIFAGAEAGDPIRFSLMGADGLERVLRAAARPLEGLDDSAVLLVLEDISESEELAARLAREESLDSLLRVARRGLAMGRDLPSPDVGELLGRLAQGLGPGLELDLIEWLESELGALREAAGEGLKLSLELPNRSARVRVDPAALRWILLELIDNCRHSAVDAQNLRLRLDLPKTASGRLELRLSDDGKGISNRLAASPLDPFSSSTGRSGLGLPIAQDFARAMGGYLDLQNSGRGAVARLELPLAASVEAKHHGLEVLPRGGETILLVEDEEAVRTLFAKILERQGYEVIVTTDGENALAVSRARKDEIDLLLTDVVMPRMGGLELSSIIQRENPEMKILFVSGYGGGAVLDRGSLPVGTAFLPKPFTPEALLRKVNMLLSKPREISG